jgi:hypothetical protein
LFVDLKNIDANVKNLTLNGEADGKLHSSLDLTCEIMQKKNTGYLGVWAETGIIGLGGDIPAVNAIVAVNGLDLDDYDQIIPMGVTTSLGGNVLDARVDASVEQEYLWVKAKIKTVRKPKHRKDLLYQLKKQSMIWLWVYSLIALNVTQL